MNSLRNNFPRSNHRNLFKEIPIEYEDGYKNNPQVYLEISRKKYGISSREALPTVSRQVNLPHRRRSAHLSDILGFDVPGLSMTRDLSEIPEPANWLNPNNKDIAFNEVKAFLNTAKTQEKFQEKMDSYELNFQGFMDTISDQEKEFIYNKINQYLQKINENNGFTAFLEQLAGWCHEC